MIKKSKFYIVYFLIIIAGLYVNLHADIAVPMNRSFSEFPMDMNGWRMEGESMFSDAVLMKLRPTDYVLRKYARPDTFPVSLYIGYHSGGKESGPIHSPKNCLPGSGWFKLKEDEISVDVGSKKINIIKVFYQKGDSREVFLYWYMVRGDTLTSEYALKLAEIRNSMMYRRRESAFIRVSVPFESNEEEAVASGIEFIKDSYPAIEEFLPD